MNSDMAKTKKVAADQILYKIRELHAAKDGCAARPPPDAFYAEVKSGPSWGQGGRKLYIMDAIAIKPSWSRPCIYGYEIKVSRSDFTRGRKKALDNYTKYCHKFSFACPVGLIKEDELPGDVGLLYYSPEHEHLFEVRRAMRREINMQSREVVGMLMYLAMYRASDEETRRAKLEVNVLKNLLREIEENCLAAINDTVSRNKTGPLWDVVAKIREVLRDEAASDNGGAENGGIGSDCNNDDGD